MMPAIAVFGILAALWFPLFRYIAPRFYVVSGPSMLPALADGDVVAGLKVHPSARMKTGGIYGYVMPGNRTGAGKRKWVIKRLAGCENGMCRFEGDNAGNSTDSRDYGPVSRESVLFEAFWHRSMKGEGGAAWQA